MPNVKFDEKSGKKWQKTTKKCQKTVKKRQKMTKKKSRNPSGILIARIGN